MSTIIEDVVGTPAPATVDLPDPTFTVRDVLLLAAEIIEERGWCRWRYVDEEGRVCALGALGLASGAFVFGSGLNREPVLFHEAERVLRKWIGPAGDSVVEWNDTLPNGFFGFGGGKKIVPAMMREAAARCA